MTTTQNTATINVVVCGPNLRDQSHGDFHVHAAGCQDLRNYGRGRKLGGEVGPVETFASLQDLVEEVYQDQMAESDSPWTDYADDFYVLPCAKALR